MRENWTISYNCYFLFSLVFLSLLLLFLCSTLIRLMIYKTSLRTLSMRLWALNRRWPTLWTRRRLFTDIHLNICQNFRKSLCGIIHWCPLSSLYPLQIIHTSRWVESISSLQRVIFLSVGVLFEETAAFSSPSRTRASCGMEKRTVK